MDYLKFANDLIEQIDKEAKFVIIHNNDVLDFEMYGVYEISEILECNCTSNLYEAIKRIDYNAEVIVYAMKFSRDEKGLPIMITLGILNKDGESWTRSE